MTKSYRTLGEINPSLFREIIAGSEPSTAASDEPSGIMTPSTRSRFSGRDTRDIMINVPDASQDEERASALDRYLQGVASAIRDSAVDKEQVADAVATPPKYDLDTMGDPAFDLENLPPIEEVLGSKDQTSEALGEPDPVNVEQSTQGAGIEMVPADGEPVEDTSVESTTDAGSADVDAKARATDTSISTQASSVPEGDVREAQTVLNTLNLYRNSIDGRNGRGTRNAIQTYQYRAGLPVTGELDIATREALGSNEVPRDERPSDYNDPLLALLSEGERTTYSSANDYNTPRRKTEWSVYGSYFSDRYNKPISEMTLDEIQDIQAGGYGNREVFAVGAYQIIPTTFATTVERMGLSGDTVFDAETQNAMGRDLLLNKPGRENLRSYLLGEEGASEEAALLDLAKEWASMPVPNDGVRANGTSYQAGDSYYGDIGQAAHASLNEVRQALRQQRNIIMKEYGKTFESEE